MPTEKVGKCYFDADFEKRLTTGDFEIFCRSVHWPSSIAKSALLKHSMYI